MSVVRVEKNEQPFTTIRNALLRDERLSFEARGLLGSLLSYPADWRFTVAGLVPASPNSGRDRIYRMLAELREFGYVTRFEVRDPLSGRVLSTEYVAREVPLDLADSPLTANPEAAPLTPLPDTANTDAYKEGTSFLVVGSCTDVTGGTSHPSSKIASRSSDAAPKRPPKPKPQRPDVEALCQHLADRIEGNGSKRPEVSDKWRTACRLMLDRDDRRPEQVRAAIDWCQDDEFWRGNVLSMPKLREQYDRLRLAAERKREQVARDETRVDPRTATIQRSLIRAQEARARAEQAALPGGPLAVSG